MNGCYDSISICFMFFEYVYLLLVLEQPSLIKPIMKTKYLLLLIITLPLYSCNKLSNISSDSYYINHADCKSDIPISAIFDSVNIIPTESINVPIVGQMEIFHYYKGCIYILDKKKHSVFIFTDKGKFVKEINRMGKGPGEYTDIKYFEINPYEETIDIMSKTGTLYRYTFDGNFIESFFAPDDLRAASFFSNLNKDTIVYYNNSETKRLTFYSKSEKRVISKKLKLPVYNIISFQSPFYKFMNNTYLFEGLEPNRYLITNADLMEHYSINFTEDQFTTKDISDYGSEKLFNEYSQGELDKPFFWTNIENKDYIITTYRKKSDNCTIIINKHSGKVTGIKSFNNGCLFPFGSTFHNGYLINVVPAYTATLFVNEKMRSEYGINENNTINEYSNPIIIVYKLKNSL